MQELTTAKGGNYFPSLMEFLISLGIVALGVFLFKMAAKHLPLFAKA
jgi:Ni/Fe-hydrogenase subunit HybB-like protein